jgi:hypothetical protein
MIRKRGNISPPCVHHVLTMCLLLISRLPAGAAAKLLTFTAAIANRSACCKSVQGVHNWISAMCRCCSVELRQLLTVAGCCGLRGPRHILDIALYHAYKSSNLHCFELLPWPPWQQPHDVPPAPTDVKDVL